MFCFVPSNGFILVWHAQKVTILFIILVDYFPIESTKCHQNDYSMDNSSLGYYDAGGADK